MDAITLQSLIEVKQSDEYRMMVDGSAKKNEEQQALKQKRDKAYAKLKRAERDRRGDEDALRRTYEEARAAYAEMRNCSGLRHGRGLAAHLHGEVECETEMPTAMS